MQVGSGYSETVLRHFREPANRERLSNPSVSAWGINTLCGDRLRLELIIDDGIVSRAAFSGDGCAVSVAAGSLLTQSIVGVPLRDAAAMDEQALLDMLDCELDDTRRKCALLVLHALREIGLDDR
ncbi:MAG: iron-sulfur cluster assembly scaffold protein [Gemmatimonadales bacterium]